MKIDNKNFKRYIAGILAVIFLATTFTVATGGFIKDNAKAESAVSSDDKKVAADISNMTGVKIDEIMKLKNEGKSWNEILELLKSRDKSSSQTDKDSRNKALTDKGIGEDYTEKLKADGFTDEEIMEAKMMVERVVFQLSEITSEKDNDIATGIVENNQEKEDDTTVYSELAGKIDTKTAVYLMLKLEKDFGSIEKVLDEYLLSLQIDIKLEDYLSDKKAYEKEKSEKSAGIDLDKIITLEKIEAKMLEKIQKQNEKNKVSGDANTSALPGMDNTLKEGNKEDPLPKAPQVEDIMPKDPLEDVMKEIDDIRDKSLNGGER